MLVILGFPGQVAFEFERATLCCTILKERAAACRGEMIGGLGNHRRAMLAELGRFRLLKGRAAQNRHETGFASGHGQYRIPFALKHIVSAGVHPDCRCKLQFAGGLHPLPHNVNHIAEAVLDSNINFAHCIFLTRPCLKKSPLLVRLSFKKYDGGMRIFRSSEIILRKSDRDQPLNGGPYPVEFLNFKGTFVEAHVMAELRDLVRLLGCHEKPGHAFWIKHEFWNLDFFARSTSKAHPGVVCTNVPTLVPGTSSYGDVSRKWGRPFFLDHPPDGSLRPHTVFLLRFRKDIPASQHSHYLGALDARDVNRLLNAVKRK